MLAGRMIWLFGAIQNSVAVCLRVSIGQISIVRLEHDDRIQLNVADGANYDDKDVPRQANPSAYLEPHECIIAGAK